MRTSRQLALAGLAGVLIGCRGAELDGAVGKGPYVLGSTIEVAPLDASGARTGEVFGSQTDNDLGEFRVDVPNQGPVALEGTGYYFDEVRGELSAGQLTLRAYYDVSGDAQVFVNPFTHLSNLRVRELDADLPFDDAIAQAEDELLEELGIGPSGFALDAAGTDLDVTGDDNDANAYVFALSAVLLTTAQLENPVAPDAALQELMNTIASDLAPDGALDGAIRTRLAAGEWAVDVPTVKGNLEARLEALGHDGDVPDLGVIIDGDGDGTAYAADCADHDAAVHPGAGELCDDADVDEDCDGLLDDADPDVDATTMTAHYQDLDGDGHGTDAATAPSCDPTGSFAAAPDDCDDDDATVHPGATEAWDGADSDCDGDDFAAFRATDYTFEQPGRPASAWIATDSDTVDGIFAIEVITGSLGSSPGGCTLAFDYSLPTFESGVTTGCPFPGFPGRRSASAGDGAFAVFAHSGATGSSTVLKVQRRGDPIADGGTQPPYSYLNYDFALESALAGPDFTDIDLTMDQALACGPTATMFVASWDVSAVAAAIPGDVCFLLPGTQTAVVCDDGDCESYDLDASFAPVATTWSDAEIAEAVMWGAVLVTITPDRALTLHDFDEAGSWALHTDRDVISAAARKLGDELFLVAVLEDPSDDSRTIVASRGRPDGTWTSTPVVVDILPGARPESVDLLVEQSGVGIMVSVWNPSGPDQLAWSWNGAP